MASPAAWTSPWPGISAISSWHPVQATWASNMALGWASVACPAMPAYSRFCASCAPLWQEKQSSSSETAEKGAIRCEISVWHWVHSILRPAMCTGCSMSVFSNSRRRSSSL